MNINRSINFRFIFKSLGLALGIGWGAMPLAQAQTNIIAVGEPTGATRNDTYVAAGFEFYAPVAGTKINALGYWDATGSGLLAPHTVTVFKYAGTGSSYHQVISATIPAGTSAPLVNGYRWVSIPETDLPNIGQGGGYYAVLAVHSQDYWANSIGAAPYMDPALGTVSGQGLIGNNTTFTVFGDPIDINGTGNPNEGFGGPNLGYLTNALPASAAPAQITWDENGTFSDNTVLAKAGPVSNEVYGVNFGVGSETTGNGYSFDDFQATGNVTLGGTANPAANYYLSGGGSTGDAALDAMLDSGYIGGNDTYCILNNLTPGQKYTVLALAADTTGVGGAAQLQETDFLTYSPAQTFTFTGGTPAIGGYLKGAFTAVATSQLFTMHSAHVQYQTILLAKYTPPIFPEIVVVTNPQPATLNVGVGGQVTYTAAFSNSPAVNVTWQFIGNGGTNDISSGVVNTTNNGILVSTLTLTNLQGANSGTYAAKAVDATNSLNFKFSLPVTLNVNALIYWMKSGAFSDNSVLALAGDPSNEVYGVDFGGSGFAVTANGYSFDDFQSSGNMDVANGPNSYDSYLVNGATTGDGALDSMLTHGDYGSPNNTGTLKNLTPGQTYYVLILLADTRGSAAGGSVFRCSDGILVSPSQQFAFADGTPSVGGYWLGRFTAAGTNQPLTVFNNYPFASQYNAILVAKTTAPTSPQIFLTSDITPANPMVGEGTNVTFTASFRSTADLTIQWQSVINGVTNVISSGVVTTNNGADVVSTLTLSNVAQSSSGSYRVEAVDAADSGNFTFSSSATLAVVPVITWTASGTFNDASVLALVGSPADVVYAVDFGGSGQQSTTNGYSFDDGITTGNMTLNGHSDFGGYMSGATMAATTGDPAFDNVLTYGSYGGSGVVGTLHNLTPGQKYNILVLLADTRGASAGGLVFVVNDGVNMTTNQIYAFADGVPAVGGYYLGSITAGSTNQTLEIRTSLALTATFYLASQYNAVVVAKSSAATAPVLAAPQLSGANLILTGTGGTPGSAYTWLQTASLTPPVTWTTNVTGVLDGNGALSNAIPVSVNQPGGLYLRLRLP
ncbi:MAG TPA: immunoglobulin domain-containing protein [Dongiaceae bacterium]|nr:immunoglobulin domain-containing protein [Dongiaceae bacterium]